jgi:gamma-glutamyl-gamma-aminobutyrate hydrolase PuuD
VFFLILNKILKVFQMDKHEGTKDYTRIDLPDFNYRSVFILNGAFYPDVVRLLASCNLKRADSVKDADIVVFIGGSDINPSLYNERCLSLTHFNTERDLFEIEIYNEAKALGKTIFGICRGAQFIHAMNGGTLWQDVNWHGGISHSIVDIDDDVKLIANSIHHQMLRLNDEIVVAAVCEKQVATRFEAEGLSINLTKNGSNASDEIEIEAGFYEKDRSFFVQGHPEVGSDEYRSWTMNKLYDWTIEWEEFDFDTDEEED